ncbi:MAG: ABC transporter substrate-binding protein [Hyphomicrobiales bacterium]|nr:ABC transporter substrate-binding protein [Hyphomicrobiales bacterium]
MGALGATIASPAIVRAAAPDRPFRLGVLTDMNGIFSDATGRGSLAAAQMAVEEFGGKVLGRPVEVISGDHQNKPDIGANIARQWYDVEKVDVILDVPVSSIGMAIQKIATDKQRMFITSAGGSVDLSGKFCSPNFIQWTYNTYALANVAGKAMVQRGGDSFFFIVADYAFGQALEKDVTDVVVKGGGKVLGRAPHPINTMDFSSNLLRAKASGAKVIALANSGGDMQSAIKQAAEFNMLNSEQKFVALLIDVSDIKSISLQLAQGLLATSGFYWNMDDRTREFAKRFEAKAGKKPGMMHAGVYSSALNYLKAIQAAGDDAPASVVKQLRAMKFDDAFARNGRLRDDNLMVHDMYLAQAKKPSESTGPDDVYNILGTISGDDAFQKLADSACPMVAKK